MSDDDRDRLVPKHPARAPTARPSSEAIVRAPSHTDWSGIPDEVVDGPTPLFVQQASPLDQISYRQRRNSVQMESVRSRLEAMEKTHSAHASTMQVVVTKADVMQTMLMTVLQMQAAESKRRDELAEKRESATMLHKRESLKLTLSIVVPTISAIAAAIAAIVN